LAWRASAPQVQSRAADPLAKRLVEPPGHESAGEANQQDAGSCRGDQVNGPGMAAHRVSRSVWTGFRPDMSEGAWR
jgi:hypothetical protein